LTVGRRLRLLVPPDGRHQEIGQLLVCLVDEGASIGGLGEQRLPLPFAFLDDRVALLLCRQEHARNPLVRSLLCLGDDPLSLLPCGA